MTETNKTSNYLKLGRVGEVLTLDELGISIVALNENLDAKLVYSPTHKAILADKSATIGELTRFLDEISDSEVANHEL